MVGEGDDGCGIIIRVLNDGCGMKDSTSYYTPTLLRIYMPRLFTALHI